MVQQYAVALTGVALPFGIGTTLLANLPIQVTMLLFLPAVPMMAVMVCFEVVILREFGKDMGLPVGIRDYVTLVLSAPFYQLLPAVGSLRAAWKYARGDFAWEKTAHIGAHLQSTAPLLPADLVIAEELS